MQPSFRPVVMLLVCCQFLHVPRILFKKKSRDFLKNDLLQDSCFPR